jgi:hypothetical protein
MSQFISRWVPILDEHTLTDDDGNELVEIDEGRLRDIARRNNRRVKATGDAAPIVIGHTQDDAPEEEQPKRVGWMTAYKVAPWRMGKKALFALCKFTKNLRNEINKYPRRSVELWLSDWKIDPLSLLGATTPERDLGLLRLAKDGGSKYRRVLPKMDQTKEIVHAVLAALKQSAVFKWAESKMAEEEAANNEPLEDEASLDDELGDDLSGDEDDLDLEGVDDDQDATTAADNELSDEEDKPLRMSANSPAPSCPSCGNTYVPSNKLRDKEKRRMQKDQKRIKLSKQERLLQSALSQMTDMRVKYQRAVREKDLIQLEAEGVDLDRVEELDRVEALDDASYEKELVRMRKRYRKAPVSGYRGDFSSTGRSITSPSGIGDKGKMQDVVALATNKGISYEQARQELGVSDE